jgi:hypothetical protein
MYTGYNIPIPAVEWGSNSTICNVDRVCICGSCIDHLKEMAEGFQHPVAYHLFTFAVLMQFNFSLLFYLIMKAKVNK